MTSNMDATGKSMACLQAYWCAACSAGGVTAAAVS
jgi:hypothetical protein